MAMENSLYTVRKSVDRSNFGSFESDVQSRLKMYRSISFLWIFKQHVLRSFEYEREITFKFIFANIDLGGI